MSCIICLTPPDSNVFMLKAQWFIWQICWKLRGYLTLIRYKIDHIWLLQHWLIGWLLCTNDAMNIVEVHPLKQSLCGYARQIYKARPLQFLRDMYVHTIEMLKKLGNTAKFLEIRWNSMWYEYKAIANDKLCLTTRNNHNLQSIMTGLLCWPAHSITFSCVLPLVRFWRQIQTLVRWLKMHNI